MIILIIVSHSIIIIVIIITSSLYYQLSEHTFLFNGAGEAGVGIANLIASSIKNELKCSDTESHKNIWLYDSKGLVSTSRTDALAHHKQPYAHVLPAAAGVGMASDLFTAVQLIKPTALIGVSAQGGSFTEAICKEMAKNNEAPLILGLSNPTSKAECTGRI